MVSAGAADQQPHAATCSRGVWRRRCRKLRCLSTAKQLCWIHVTRRSHNCCLLSTVPVTNAADVLAAALVPEGYSCFFRAKKPSPATKFGFPADGIALFYRHSRFSCSPAPEGAQAGCQARHSHLLGAEGLCPCSGKGMLVAWNVTILTATQHCCAVLCCRACRCAAHCFESMDGHPAAQGFVTALLFDKQAQKHVLVAVTHLKAKADNEQTRVHQVGARRRCTATALGVWPCACAQRSSMPDVLSLFVAPRLAACPLCHRLRLRGALPCGAGATAAAGG